MCHSRAAARLQMKEGTAQGAAALGRAKLLKGTGGMGSTGETELLSQASMRGTLLL